MKTEEAKNILSSMEKPETPDEIIDAYSGVAKELGIDISVEELTEYLSEEIASGEVDDEELSRLTGSGDHTDCKITFKDKENCRWDDACDIIYYKYDDYKCKSDFYGSYSMLGVV